MKLWKTITLSLIVLGATAQVGAIFPSEINELDTSFRASSPGGTPSSTPISRSDYDTLAIGDAAGNHLRSLIVSNTQPYRTFGHGPYVFLNDKKTDFSLTSHRGTATDEEQVPVGTVTLDDLPTDLQTLVAEGFKFNRVFVDADQVEADKDTFFSAVAPLLTSNGAIYLFGLPQDLLNVQLDQEPQGFSDFLQQQQLYGTQAPDEAANSFFQEGQQLRVESDGSLFLGNAQLTLSTTSNTRSATDPLHALESQLNAEIKKSDLFPRLYALALESQSSTRGVRDLSDTITLTEKTDPFTASFIGDDFLNFLTASTAPSTTAAPHRSAAAAAPFLFTSGDFMVVTPPPASDVTLPFSDESGSTGPVQFNMADIFDTSAPSLETADTAAAAAAATSSTHSDSDSDDEDEDEDYTVPHPGKLYTGTLSQEDGNTLLSVDPSEEPVFGGVVGNYVFFPESDQDDLNGYFLITEANDSSPLKIESVGNVSSTHPFSIFSAAEVEELFPDSLSNASLNYSFRDVWNYGVGSRAQAEERGVSALILMENFGKFKGKPTVGAHVYLGDENTPRTIQSVSTLPNKLGVSIGLDGTPVDGEDVTAPLAFVFQEYGAFGEYRDTLLLSDLTNAYDTTMRVQLPVSPEDLRKQGVKEGDTVILIVPDEEDDKRTLVELHPSEEGAELRLSGSPVELPSAAIRILPIDPDTVSDPIQWTTPGGWKEGHYTTVGQGGTETHFFFAATTPATQKFYNVGDPYSHDGVDYVITDVRLEGPWLHVHYQLPSKNVETTPGESSSSSIVSPSETSVPRTHLEFQLAPTFDGRIPAAFDMVQFDGHAPLMVIDVSGNSETGWLLFLEAPKADENIETFENPVISGPSTDTTPRTPRWSLGWRNGWALVSESSSLGQKFFLPGSVNIEDYNQHGRPIFLADGTQGLIDYATFDGPWVHVYLQEPIDISVALAGDTRVFFQNPTAQEEEL